MKILVTGATGFVGGHLVPALARAYPDAELILCGSGGGYVPLDLTETDAVTALVATCRPDACIHLAAVTAAADARAHPEHAWSVNLSGTLALARAILAQSPHCRLVFASSGDCYGASFRGGQPLDETSPLAPLNAYAATKAAADLALGAMIPDGLSCLRLRAFNHTGVGQSASFVVPAFARQVALIAARLQPPVLQVGALALERDFLDVRDVCAAYVAAVDPARPVASGGILNIASGQPRRIGDILDGLLARAGVQAEIVAAPGLLRPADVARAVGQAAAAGAALGWAPRISWDQTLDEVLADWMARVRREAP